MEFTIEREDCTLFCRKEGKGPLLLLIHGVACDSDYFKDTTKYLVKHFTVVSYDRRGYSRSVMGRKYIENRAEYAVAVQTEDAALIIKQQQMGAALVVGCSAGGIIAVSLASRYPELVCGLFLQEPPLAGSAQIQEQIDDWISELRFAAERKQINKALLSFTKVMGGTDKRVKSKSLESQLQDLENLKVFVYKEMEDFLHYKLQDRYPGCANQNVQSEKKAILEETQIPCVIAAGECDKEGLFSRAAESAAERMNWQLIRTPGYHNLPADLPYEFAMIVLSTAVNILNIRISNDF